MDWLASILADIQASSIEEPGQGRKGLTFRSDWIDWPDDGGNIIGNWLE